MDKILFASSQTVCDLLGCNIYDKTGGLKPTGINGQITQIIRFGVTLIFILIILFGVILIIRAALTIINSNGNESKVEEGAKAIKGVFIGLGIIVAGVIGIVVLLAFFSVGGQLDSKINTPTNLTNIPIITN